VAAPARGLPQWREKRRGACPTSDRNTESAMKPLTVDGANPSCLARPGVITRGGDPGRARSPFSSAPGRRRAETGGSGS